MSSAPTVETRSFHSLKPDYINTIYSNSRMSPADTKLVQAFIEGKQNASVKNEEKKHFGLARERRLLQHLRVLREFSPVDYSKITNEHLLKIMPAIKNAKIGKDTYNPILKKDGEPAKPKRNIGTKRFSQNTYRDVIASSKMFFKWLAKNNKSSLSRDEIDEIGIPKADERTIEDKDLLTEESRDMMIKACQNSRDRAIISLMFEAGLRPVEIGRLTHADVEFTSNSMNIKTAEKTGRERKIPAPVSKMYVKAWLNDCPYDPSPDAVVFCSLTPTILPDDSRQWLPLKDDAIRRQIKTIAQNAGIKNYRKLYQFRHTAISSWINGGLPERMAMEMSHGGDTKMLRIYYHVTHDEVERRVLALNGMETSEPVKKAPTALVCAGCGSKNPVTLRFCGNCGEPLSEEAKKSKESVNASLDTLAMDDLSDEEIGRAIREFKMKKAQKTTQ